MKFAVIGSGYGGSILASILKKLGHDVILVEKGCHPKFAIGESSTPLANFLLERIGLDYNLPHLHQLSNWGRWQKYHPNINVGLKRGFTFFFYDKFGNLTPDQTMRMAASPDNLVADTQWYRPEFDHFLVEQAINIGVEYFEHTSVDSVSIENEKCSISLSVKEVENKTIAADYLIDATGNKNFSDQFLGREKDSRRSVTGNRFAVFAHFENVAFSKNGHQSDDEFPFAYDDSAVHHLFEGGWVWTLRFKNGIVSAGASLSMESYAHLLQKEPHEIWHHVLDNLPALKNLFLNSRPISAFHKFESTGFATDTVIGNKWIKLPSSCGFVDPLLSTGFALNLLGIGRLAKVFSKSTSENQITLLKQYVEDIKEDLDEASKYITRLLSFTHSPMEFKNLSLVYFAGIIQQEIKSRLGLCSPFSGFLNRNNTEWFRLADNLLTNEKVDGEFIKKISSWDLAGITGYPNWQIPASKSELLKNCHKIPASKEQIELMLDEARQM